MKILQVASYVTYDLQRPQTLPKELSNFIKNNVCFFFNYRIFVIFQQDIMIKLRYTKPIIPIYEEFKDALYYTARLDVHATKPTVQLATGAFVDAFMLVD